jgi:hypothetical protein
LLKLREIRSVHDGSTVCCYPDEFGFYADEFGFYADEFGNDPNE